MVPTSVLCRTQERLHRRRAADTTLENVRLVATNAAQAWAKEAVAAECREARQLRVRAHADAVDAQDADVLVQDDPSPGENPDRGLATVTLLS